ncbi:thioredoxin fold domain-containing protein [Photobacterium toruni]|uniref:thioredoxin fold domain-containing protein n=1 Tax=Photobacterium toruni TaxID=1935446 RepID=UPI00210F84BF|nr:thioredoxin fold domain-containing protein [Photobacterium toruni]
MKKKLTSLIVASVFGSFLCGTAFNAYSYSTKDSKDVDKQKVEVKHAAIAPPQLEQLIKNGVVKLVETFKHGNYVGYLVESDGEYHLYWATNDNMVIAGPLIDANGYNITDQYLNEKMPKPDYSAIYKDILSDKGVINTHPEYKSDKGAMYVFVEPFCGWCAKYHQQLEPLIKNGLNVKWVPVSFLSEKSNGVIQHVFDQANPSEAWDLHVDSLHKSEPIVSVATEATKAAISGNSELMQRLGAKGTPATVYMLNGKVHVGGIMEQSKLIALAEQLNAERIGK